MKRQTTYRIGIFCIILIYFYLVSMPVSGCTVPVFRYALERWPAFNYTVEIAHKGNLNEEQKNALRFLYEKSKEKNGSNLKVVELTKPGEIDGLEKNLPTIRLYCPVEQGNPDIIWQGQLSLENVQKIVNSPARGEVFSRIQKGEATVWVLLKGKDEIRNKKAYDTLKNELEALSKELKLATSATDVDGNPLNIEVINRGVRFSMVSVSRDDPQEEIFIKMLLATEPDLPFVKAPMAFPVFGRGRVLFALVGAGIKPKLIKSTCNSVIGWCSCTVKEDNPGSDLLFTGNWEKAIGDSLWVQDVEMPEITGVSEFMENEPSVQKKAQEPVAAPDTIPEEKVSIKNPETVQENVQKDTIEIEEKVDTLIKSEEPITTVSLETKTKKFNLLYRNILIAIVAFILVLFVVSIYFKRKGFIGNK